MRSRRPGRIAIVASRFNSEVTDRLLESCLARLSRGGVPRSAVDVVRVPGAWEIPWAVQERAGSRRYGCVIALGAVLQGRTSQNEHLSRSVFQALQLVALKTRVPCVLGVITPRTSAQAMARTRGELDRGRESAEAALDLLRLGP